MTDGSATGSGVRVSDPRVMRALAHPARIEIVDYLHHTGAVVTATECAGMVGLSPSATSYHLRELAKFGLVEQAPSRGDGRERVWRSVGSRLRIEGDLSQPETRDAERALVEAYLARDLQATRDWMRRQADEPEEWRTAGWMARMSLLVTAEEMSAINERISELLEPYRMRERRDSAPAGARGVQIQFAAIPDEAAGLREGDVKE